MNVQFKKGVLELVVLSLINQRDFYGFELVSEISKDINISEGTIYPLLKRMKDEGYLETYLTESAAGAARKYYRLTPLGSGTLHDMEDEWYRFVKSVNNVLKGEEI